MQACCAAPVFAKRRQAKVPDGPGRPVSPPSVSPSRRSPRSCQSCEPRALPRPPRELGPSPTSRPVPLPRSFPRVSRRPLGPSPDGCLSLSGSRAVLVPTPDLRDPGTLGQNKTDRGARGGDSGRLPAAQPGEGAGEIWEGVSVGSHMSLH